MLPGRSPRRTSTATTDLRPDANVHRARYLHNSDRARLFVAAGRTFASTGWQSID
jgi:hypothetical protein